MNDWIADAEARADDASEGPWGATIYAGRDAVLTAEGSGYFVCDTGGGYGSEQDAAFIANARTDLPRALVALRAVLELADSHDRYAAACDADVNLPHLGEHWRQEAHKARDEAKRIRRAVGIDQDEE